MFDLTRVMSDVRAVMSQMRRSRTFHVSTSAISVLAVVSKQLQDSGMEIGDLHPLPRVLHSQKLTLPGIVSGSLKISTSDFILR